MSFLNRRSPRSQCTDTTLTPHDTQSNTNTLPGATTTSIGRARSSSLIRRVSMMFSTKKKDLLPPHLRPLGNIACQRTPLSRFPSRTESSASDDDIRPPSGLGFSVPRLTRVSSDSSLLSAPSNRLPFCQGRGYERSRAMSSPGLLRFNSFSARAIPPRWADQQSADSFSEDEIISPSASPASPVTSLPPEVLDTLLSFLTNEEIVPLASVSSEFCLAVQKRLYSTLDLRDMDADNVDQLSSLLASRWDLADFVHTLICDRWPSCEILLHNASMKKRFTFLSASLPMLSSSYSPFSSALRNMRHLTILTIPSFDMAIFGDRPCFRLKVLTLLTTTMSKGEQRDLFEWLTSQPNITELSFPNLVDPPCNSPDSDSCDELPPTPPPKPKRLPDTYTNLSPLSPRRNHHSTTPALLPSLTVLHAPPSLTTLLAPKRPLKQIIIHIRTNLDTGLRPSALMTPIRGVPHLGVRFGENVDRRSVEKVMRAAATVLGGVCKRLDVEVRGAISDEALYKIIHLIIPRFLVLHTLTLDRPTPAPPSSDRSSNHHTAKSEIMVPELNDRDDEDAHLTWWRQHCPTLRTVRFLSQAEWCADDG